MQALLARRRRVLRSLPPLEEILRGSLFVRTLRCGREGCHCAQGEGHRVVYLSVTLPGGRTEQISLPARLVPMATRWVANYHSWWAAMERISTINRRLLRSHRQAGAGPARSGGGIQTRPRPR